MRITFVLPAADLSGGVRVVATYAERLTQRGHDVLVVSTPPRRAPLRRRLRRLLRGDCWRESAPTPSHLDGRPVLHRRLERFRPVTDRDLPDADVVIATWWETAEWVAALGDRKGAKVYFVQNDLHDGLPLDRVEATLRLPMHPITISESLRTLLRQRCPDRGVSLVYNGVDHEQFDAPPRGRQRVPTVGLLYHRARFKGCDVSLRAVERARRDLPQLALQAFGVPAPTPELRLPPGSRYYRMPAQDQLRHIYASCDVWICGSRRGEGFHLPPLEAMACRCPVVSTRCGGPQDLVEQGRNGLLVDQDDVEGLAAALVSVLKLPEASWHAMSEYAWKTARRYSWELATTRFEEALAAAVRSREAS